MPHLNHGSNTPPTATYRELGNVYVSEKQLTERFSVHRSTIRRWISDRGFPAPVRFSDNCSRWPIADVIAWEAARARG